jgi:hypothetical protein
LVLVEPWTGPMGFLFYRFVHHEDCYHPQVDSSRSRSGTRCLRSQPHDSAGRAFRCPVLSSYGRVPELGLSVRGIRRSGGSRAPFATSNNVVRGHASALCAREKGARALTKAGPEPFPRNETPHQGSPYRAIPDGLGGTATQF